MSLTHSRDLRNGKPVWTAYRHRGIRASRLSRSTRADVVIVGAGITGALVAEALTECGLRPLILDRRRGPLLGSTSASTALLQFELDTPLIHLSRRTGARAATRVWRCSKAAVDELRTRVLRLGLAVQPHTRPSLYLAGDLLDARGLQREARARQRAGLPSEYVDARTLRHHLEIGGAGAILSHEIPDHPRCYSVLGYGGNGITFSMLAAQFLSAAVRGRAHPDARLFRSKQ